MITKDPKVSFSVNLVKATISESFSLPPGPFRHNTVPTGGSHVLTYTYTKSASDSDTFVPNWGNYSIKYTANSDVYLPGTQIKNVTKVTAHAHINVDGGVTEGDWAVYSLTSYYNIGANAQGLISVTLKQDPISDQSQKPNPNWWSELLSLATIDNC
jgi:hypothetical protein